MNARYAAIILAGGFSTRMRRLKALLPLDKATITDHAIATFQNSGIEVFLVVGHRMEEIKQGIIARNITIVDNPDYRKGMFSSVQAGISRLDKEHRGFFILPADIPLIREATIKHLTNAAGNHPENIIYPVFRGKRGHPPLIPSSIIPAILGWNGEDGLKGALRSQEKLALEIPVADRNILFDVDTPEDYQELLRRFQFYDLPSDEECEVIYTDICKVTTERVRHCLKMSATAVAIGQALNTSGKSIDLELIRKAAVLHDIAKGQPKHDIAGGKILKELGFGKVSDIVGVHTELAGGNINLPLESKIVFLADKFIEGEKQVSLEERYGSVNRRHGKTPEIEALVMARLEVALYVKQEFEKIIGCPLENIIRSLER